MDEQRKTDQQPKSWFSRLAEKLTTGVEYARPFVRQGWILTCLIAEKVADWSKIAYLWVKPRIRPFAEKSKERIDVAARKGVEQIKIVYQQAKPYLAAVVKRFKAMPLPWRVTTLVVPLSIAVYLATSMSWSSQTVTSPSVATFPTAEKVLSLERDDSDTADVSSEVASGDVPHKQELPIEVSKRKDTDREFVAKSEEEQIAEMQSAYEANERVKLFESVRRDYDKIPKSYDLAMDYFTFGPQRGNTVNEADWYEAADAGMPEGMILTGMLRTWGLFYRTDSDPEKWVLSLFRKASDKGNIVGTHWLGECYTQGIGRTDSKKRIQDENKGIAEFLIAAKQGYTESMYRLGEYYLEKAPNKKSQENDAIQWLVKAADKDHERSQFLLGTYYLQIPGNASRAKAEQYLQQSNKNGYEFAGKVLQLLNAEKQDKNTARQGEAVSWENYLKAIGKSEFPYALSDLGDISQRLFYYDIYFSASTSYGKHGSNVKGYRISGSSNNVPLYIRSMRDSFILQGQGDYASSKLVTVRYFESNGSVFETDRGCGFLTKDGRIRSCQPDEVPYIRESGGVVYWREERHSQVSFDVFGTAQTMKPFERPESICLRIYFTNAKWDHPEQEGWLRADAIEKYGTWREARRRGLLSLRDTQPIYFVTKVGEEVPNRLMVDVTAVDIIPRVHKD